LLKSKNSPAVPEASLIYDQFVAGGVDPTFALSQFRVESQFGTSGYAKTTGSWGNMLWDANLTVLATGKYSPGNGYTYATYDNYKNATLDYIRYLDWYRDHYGYWDIYRATARWIGKTPGSTGHLSYVSIIVDDMISWVFPEGTFYETGDKMIYATNEEGIAFSNGAIRQKYPITYGMPLYRGTNGDLLKNYSGTAGNAWFLGLVNGSKDWGVILIKTSSADSNGTLVYIKNIDTTKIVNVV
jgi:hypothetical protein